MKMMEQLRALPKAELHLHLEGSLAPEALWRLAQQQGFPLGLDIFDKCKNLYAFEGFGGFIQAIKTASQLLQTPADYAFAVSELARQLQRQGVAYAEVFVSLGILLWRKVEIAPYWEAIEAATRTAEAATGVRMRWLGDAVRQFGAEPFERVVDWAIKLQSSFLLGVGIGGDETLVPTDAFVPGFARARAAGLHTTMHAGETMGPASVREAIELLHAERIGHALTAAGDRAVMELIAATGTKIDSCQISNAKTGVWAAGTRHPVRAFFEAGLQVSVSSDDPGIFGCSLLDEYALLHEVNGFTPAEVLQMAGNAWECSFLSAAERSVLRLLPPLAAADAGGD
ncbi:MAG TPA: adenosine deaminase [Terriglobales bacterium]|jgi:adenosine deaminase/aminodeoxyfutalosine deaminase